MILVPVVREQQQHFPTTGISLEEPLKKIQNFSEKEEGSTQIRI